MKNEVQQLTEEEKAAGIELISIPLNELETVDVSDRNVERMARGYIMGTQAIGRRKEVRELLEKKVTDRIGRKGKYLTDKLFELIEGVYVQEGSKKTGIRYYQVPPNLNAIIYALDRVLGKPTQHTEHVEERRGVMVIEAIIRNLAGDKPSLQKTKEGLSLMNEKNMLKMQEGEEPAGFLPEGAGTVNREMQGVR